MCGSAQSACADRSKSALEPASTGHVEFVDDCAAFDIGNLNVQGKNGSACAKVSEEITSERTAAIDEIELPFHQPTNTRSLAVSKNTGRRHFLQLFLKIAREFDWSQRFADWHLACGIGLVALEDRGVDAKWTDVNRTWAMGAHATIGDHVHAFGAEVLGIHGRSAATAGGRLGLSDVHVAAGAKEKT